MGQEMSMKKILVIGSTGTGKSALCNRIITPSYALTCLDVFRASDDVYSETKDTVGQKGIWDNMEVMVIDTPGMNDSDGEEAQHIQNMIAYLKAETRIHAIFLTFNAQQERFDSNIQRLICLLTSVFKSDDFWDHVALVFTKSFASVKINHDLKRQKYGAFVADIVKSTRLMACKNPQCYFVDSKDMRDLNTKTDLSFLNAWVSSLGPMNTNALQQPDEKYLTADYTKMREVARQLELKEKQLKQFHDEQARQKKENDLYHSLRGALDGSGWPSNWGNTDRGTNSTCFTFQGRRVNAFEEKWINRNFAQIILTDASTGQSATGTASYSNDGVNSYDVRRSSACRQYIKIGFSNGWW